MAKHGLRLDRYAVSPKIGEHTAPQKTGLAHIEHRALGILIKVHARAQRYGPWIWSFHDICSKPASSRPAAISGRLCRIF